MGGYRLANYQGANGPRAGIIIGDSIFDAAKLLGSTSYATMLGILEDWPRTADLIQTATGSRPSDGFPLAQAHLRAPVLWPSAIYCAGANYRDHAAEMAQRLGRPQDPDPKASGGQPWHFLKAPHSVADPGASIAATGYSKKLDWEVELAAVIGRPAKNVPAERALDFVAGYTCANDLSARDLSKRLEASEKSPFHFDWTGQKSFDGACPLGPWIVPADDIPDPQDLSLKLWVNDVPKQDSNTREMIFTLAEQIAQLSRGMTLYPGDVILTGTPAGVGTGRGEFLKAGDVVKIEIERIGTLTNIIV
ncbi:MAG TPA: fumarylacetoacetate hydrolase family protein [Micropepsaceae bacterium]|nr:fumarylacetoacetate hydrolase family protein [Micropepsaceae bacterium]